MDTLHECIDGVVSSGIRSYLGLLCNGEIVHSRKLFTDTMELSSLAAEWRDPCVAVAEDGAYGGTHSLPCQTLSALRGVLASLLLLRPTVYWARVPELRELQDQCARLNQSLRDEGETGLAAQQRRPGPHPVTHEAALA